MATLSTRARTAVAQQVGSFSGEVARKMRSVKSGAALGRSLAVWVLEEGVSSGKRVRRTFQVRDTKTWHHQVHLGKRVPLYARSAKTDESGTHVVTGLAESALPSKIEKGLQWLHRRRRLVRNIRLLIAPCHNVTALWCVIGDEQAVVPIEVPALLRKIIKPRAYAPPAFGALIQKASFVQRRPREPEPSRS